MRVLDVFTVVRSLCLVALTVGLSRFSMAETSSYAVRSPDGTVVLTLHTEGALLYDLTVDGKPVVLRSAIELDLAAVGSSADGPRLGAEARVGGQTHRSVDTMWTNEYGTSRQVRDHYNEVVLHLKDHGRRFDLVARAYDDGAAFRLVLPRQKGLETFTVTRDATEFAFPAEAKVWAGKNNAEGPSRPEGGFVGSQEWQFVPSGFGGLKPEFKYGLPFLVHAPGAYVAVTEADLLDWAGLWLEQKPGAVGTMRAALAPPLPAKPWPERIQANRTASGVSDAPPPTGPVQTGLVVATTPHNSPWRAFLVGRHAADLLGTNLVLNLATPNRLGDTSSWVRPGMASWGTWWPGTGHNDLAMIERYIDLAAAMGWPYQLTEGRNRAIVPEEVAYGKERNVRIWLWFHFNEFADPASYRRDFPKYAQMGVAGLKIDFIDRDDQWAVNWYEDVVKVAAENHLMIDFHGAYKPTGLERTYPNQITREGIQGNEYNKWSTRETPEHRATLPFTRALVGPADYTPGGFLNRQPAEFVAVQAVGKTNTQVQSTRAGELAMFLLIPSPVVVAADSVEHYKTETGGWQPGMDFLKELPTTWDETHGLAGEVGEYVVEARRHGASWYVGAITDRQRREVTVPLSFLGKGRWKVTMWQDAPDSGDHPEHLECVEKVVGPAEALALTMAPSGGMVAIFSPAK